MNPATDTPTHAEATRAEALARRYHAALHAEQEELRWPPTPWEELPATYRGRMERAMAVALAEEGE